MAAPPAPLIWPQGLTKDDVPSPEDLMKIDENLRDMGLRVASIDEKSYRLAAALSSWNSITPRGSPDFSFGIVYDPVSKLFLNGVDDGADLDIYSSENGITLANTSSVIADIDGFTCHNIVTDGTTSVMSFYTGGSCVATATDGLTWTKRTLPGSANNNVPNLVWSGSSFVSVGQGPFCDVSVGGTSWSAAGAAPATHGPLAADESTNTVAMAGTGSWYVTTDDAATAWSTGGFAGTSPDGGCVTFDPDNDRFLFGGSDSVGPCIFVLERDGLSNGTTIRPTGLLASETSIDDIFYFEGALVLRCVDTMYYSVDGGATVHLVHGVRPHATMPLNRVGNRMFTINQAPGSDWRIYLSQPYLEFP